VPTQKSRNKSHNAHNPYKIYLGLSILVAFGRGTVWSTSDFYQAQVVRLNPMQLVLVGTALEVVIFILQVPTGALADLYSRRLSVILGYLLMGASFLLEALIPRFEAILLAQLFLGAGYTLVSGATEAWVADEIGEAQAGQAFLRATQWGLLGSLAAVLFGQVLANLFAINTPMIIGSLILLATASGLFFWMPERHFRPTPREGRNSWQYLRQQIGGGGKVVLASPMLLCILGVTLFIGLASEGFDRLNVAHFNQDFVLPALWGLKSVTWFGMISIGGTLLTLLATEIVRRCVDTERPRVLIGSLLLLNSLLIVAVAVFALATNFYLALVAYGCAVMLRTVREPLHGTWLTRYTSANQRATVFSFDGMVDPFGQIAGGPLIGLVGTFFSLRAALAAVSLIMSPALLFLLRALRLNEGGSTRTEAPMTQETIVEQIVER
jgi:DHA3 family tetracycline resistance protein-like MFS transporter